MGGIIQRTFCFFFICCIIGPFYTINKVAIPWDTDDGFYDINNEPDNEGKSETAGGGRKRDIHHKTLEEMNEVLSMITEKNDSAFDILAQTFYSKATSTSRGTKRQKIDVSGWSAKSESWGGLFTEDRELISKLYFNASSIFEYGLGESTYIAAQTKVPRYAGKMNFCEWLWFIL